MDDEILLTTARFSVVKRRYHSPEGATGEHVSVQHPGAVVIVPVLSDDRICLISNFRAAVGETLIELPAGTLEPGEEPIACARRELTEETGYHAGRLQRLHAFYVSPGILHERMYLFTAHDLVEGTPRPQAGEHITRLVVPWNEALAMVVDGRVQDAKTICGILLYERERLGGQQVDLPTGA